MNLCPSITHDKIQKSTYLLRVPTSVKTTVVRRAKADGTSFNQFVAMAVSEKLAAMNTYASKTSTSRKSSSEERSDCRTALRPPCQRENPYAPHCQSRHAAAPRAHVSGILPTLRRTARDRMVREHRQPAYPTCLSK